MKTALFFTVTSVVAADEDCLADDNVLLQVKTRDSTLDFALAEEQHDVGMMNDFLHHGIGDCDAWCEIDHFKQRTCDWETNQASKPAERFCEWSDPAFVEFPWETMDKDHAMCMGEVMCTDNFLHWPEWPHTENDPIQQCLDDVHHNVWCVGDFWCEMSKVCGAVAEAEIDNPEAYWACEQHHLRDAPVGVTCPGPEDEWHQSCMCEAACTNNWSDWFFDQEGLSNSKCLEDCWHGHDEVWLLQNRNRAAAQMKAHSPGHKLSLIQAKLSEGPRGDHPCIWDELHQEHESCWHERVCDDCPELTEFIAGLDANLFCLSCPEEDPWRPQCVLENVCSGNQIHFSGTHNWTPEQWSEYDMCAFPPPEPIAGFEEDYNLDEPHSFEEDYNLDEPLPFDDAYNLDHTSHCYWDNGNGIMVACQWCLASEQCPDYECQKDIIRQKTPEEMCAGSGDDWYSQCIAENQCTENWTAEWLECPMPNAGWYQPLATEECIYKARNPQDVDMLNFMPYGIPEGCFSDVVTGGEEFFATATAAGNTTEEFYATATAADNTTGSPDGSFPAADQDDSFDDQDDSFDLYNTLAQASSRMHSKSSVSERKALTQRMRSMATIASGGKIGKDLLQRRGGSMKPGGLMNTVGLAHGALRGGSQ